MCINAQKVDVSRWTDEKKLATVRVGNFLGGKRLKRRKRRLKNRTFWSNQFRVSLTTTLQLFLFIIV